MTTYELLRYVDSSTDILLMQNVKTAWGEQSVCKSVGFCNGKLLWNDGEIPNMNVTKIEINNGELALTVEELKNNDIHNVDTTPETQQEWRGL